MKDSVAEAKAFRPVCTVGDIYECLAKVEEDLLAFLALAEEGCGDRAVPFFLRLIGQTVRFQSRPSSITAAFRTRFLT